MIIGGRTLFDIADILTRHNLADYLAHPINFIAIWNGGMAFHGGLVGVIVATFLFLRKHRQLPFLVLTDEVVVLLPIGIALTRIVNFINDELPGNVCNPDRPYCINFPNFDGPRYPSQLFECVLDIAVLPILLLLYRRAPARRRGRMDVVHPLRRHPFGRRDLARAGAAVLRRDHGRSIARAADDRHRPCRIVVQHPPRAPHAARSAGPRAAPHGGRAHLVAAGIVRARAEQRSP